MNPRGQLFFSSVHLNLHMWASGGVRQEGVSLTIYGGAVGVDRVSLSQVGSLEGKGGRESLGYESHCWAAE